MNTQNNLKAKALLLLLLMAAGTAKAQNYEPILQEGNVWYTLDVTTGLGIYEPDKCKTLVNWISGDTLVEGVRYSKIMETVNDVGNPYLVALLREEEGKVWVRKRPNGFQSEVLLYNFNANVGDTLSFGDFEESFIVDSISFEQIGGRERKKIWFWLEYEPFGSETWIEGIGSDMGLLYCGWFHATGGYYKSLCFHQNEELVWQNPEYDACLITSVEETEMQRTCIYPNPTSDVVSIEGSVKTLAVFNSFGQCIFSGTTNTIDMRDWPNGVYFIRVTDEAGMIGIAKLVKQW